MNNKEEAQANISKEGISSREYQDRLEKTRAAIADAGMVGLIAFGDCWRAANVSYFTEFRPLDGISDIAMALFILPVDGEPSLFVSEQTLGYAASVTDFSVHPFQDLTGAFKESARNLRYGSVELAGSAYIPATLMARLNECLPKVRLESTSILAEIKAVKSAKELYLMQKAAELTDAAMAAIRDVLADGKSHSERELARAADVAMLVGGAERTAYDSMVQAGPRSVWNLARPTDRILQPGDLVMTDIGARYLGYVADGGRGFTYGPASPEKTAIIDAAATAVEVGMSTARPGMIASNLNAVIQQALIESGYEQYSDEARGHGTGHGTGMDPEEEAPWIGPGNQTVLKENMAFTLKATITVPGVGGLRTERIVRLNSSGCEALDSFPMRLHW